MVGWRRVGKQQQFHERNNAASFILNDAART
jgi:hypothetical protein